MSQHSFNDGRTIELNISTRKSTTAYDSGLKFNRVVESRDNDPSKDTYSINPSDILKALERDHLDELYRITLAARSVRNGVGFWDTLFNYGLRQSLTACIHTAQNDYTPIPQERVDVTSRFLDFSMAVSRTNLNQLIPSDRVGIAIYDHTRETTYILLYIIEDQCTAPALTQGLATERPAMVPAFNVKMEHALLINPAGQTTFVDMDDSVTYNEEQGTPFVQHLSDTVHDIVRSYSWKPHLLPVNPAGFKRDVLEERIGDVITNDKAIKISYPDLEDLFRNAYRQAKPTGAKPVGGRRRPGAQKNEPAKKPPRANLPVVEIVSLDNRKFYVKLAEDVNPENVTYTFDLPDIGSRHHTETFLLNQDLKGVLLEESSKLMVLTESVFGPNAYIRFFSLNF